MVSGTFLGDLSDRQAAVQREARDVLDREWSTGAYRAMVDAKQGFPRELWRTLCALGWPGTTLPERFGGAGGSFAELAALVEELGRALAPVPLVTAAVGVHAVELLESESQLENASRSVIRGDVPVALAAREPEPAQDIARAHLPAGRSGGSYALTGSKVFVPYADLAEAFLVPTRLSEARPELGLFLVQRSAPGLGVRRLTPLDWSSLWEVMFDAAEVPEDRLMRRGDEAYELVDDALLYERVATVAEMLGVAKAALELAVDYAKNRVAFGRPIGAFQAVKHRLVDLRVILEVQAALLQAAVHAIVTDSLELPAAGARAVFWAIDGLRKVPEGSLQVFGGVGFTWDHDIHLYLRRAATLGAMLGERRWQAGLIVEQLQKDAARPGVDDAI